MVKMSQKNNNVLFIAGPGRSGSTLLDLLLGQIDGFCSTGEMRYIWERGFAQNQLCGCGKPFRECEFWTQVVKEAFGGFENVDYVRFEGLRRAAERRVSSGLSPDEAYNQPPAQHKAERGLNENGYIIPGLGGLGELLNNTWV